jgi:trehalose 6-phosphate synthase/phosphatase
MKKVVGEYDRAKTRLILLDYDGTLVPFDHDHRVTHPGKGIISLLQSLAADTRNSVLLISGRDRKYLETQFRGLPITLVAEHGGYYRKGDGNWNTMLVSSTDWIPNALAALQAFVFQYPDSFVEQKTFSLAWHYRKIADSITKSDKQQILTVLKALPEQAHFVISDSEFTIELRTPGIDKGTFISRWVGDRYFDFTMSIGDSHTDEDVFKVLGADAYSIKVGHPMGSFANFYLESQEEVLPILLALLA